MEIALAADALCCMYDGEGDERRVRRCMMGGEVGKGHLMEEEEEEWAGEEGKRVEEVIEMARRKDEREGVPDWYDERGKRFVCKKKRHAMFFPFRKRNVHMVGPWQRGSCMYNYSFLVEEGGPPPDFDLDVRRFKHSPLSLVWMWKDVRVRRHILSLPEGKGLKEMAVLLHTPAWKRRDSLPEEEEEEREGKVAQSPFQKDCSMIRDVSRWAPGENRELVDMLMTVLRRSLEESEDRFGVCTCCFFLLCSSCPSSFSLTGMWREKIMTCDEEDKFCSGSGEYILSRGRRDVHPSFSLLSLSSILDWSSAVGGVPKIRM